MINESESKEQIIDILIIGAGPAGANLARLLGSGNNKREYSVCLLDKRRLDLPIDNKRQKACGGLLSPDAQKILAKLGLTLPASVLEDPQIFKVRTIDFDNKIERYYPRHYLNMDREKFDRYLFNLIPSSIDRRCGSIVTGIYARDGYWEVHYQETSPEVIAAYEIDSVHDPNQNIPHVIKTKFLVGADGANSFVKRKCLPENPSSKKYFSIQKWYTLKETLPYFTGIFDSEITDYYSWTIQKGDHLILGTAIPCDDSPQKSAEEKFEKLERKISEHLGLYLGNPIKTEGAFIERTTRLKHLCFSGQVIDPEGNVLPLALLGEAAGATSPTSAEGFSYALMTSLKLFESLESGINHAEKRFDLSCGEIRRNLILKQIKSPAMYWPKIRGAVMASGLTALKEPYKEYTHFSQTTF